MTARLGGKTGGRKRGSIDREARKLLTDKMSADLMFCYAKLGGRNWLLEYARDNPREFIQFGLSRLWPAPAKDDPDVLIQQAFVSSDSEFESARRVAFALAKATYQQGDITPQSAYQPPLPMTPHIPEDMRPPLLEPEPTVDADKQLWIEELELSPEQRRDAQLVRSSKSGSLATYHGSSAEQGGHGPVQHTAATKRTAAELCRSLSRRGRDLL